MAHVPSLPALPPPPPPDVGVATSHQPPPEVQQSHKTTHHKASAKPAAGTETANTAAPDKSQTPAANDAASNVSPLGQLSSTGENVSAGRGDIEQLITSTDKGLSNINRALSSQEQLTSTQIRAFLTKARQALSDNDLDGAHTLAVKAQVLLEELTKK
jgi:outer membrane biosynthesis protein TonB